MSGGRLPKRTMFGNLEGAVRGGRGGKEKEWTDCVQSDIRAFGITGDWKTMALEAEVWVEAVTVGGRRFMAAWREEEEDAARHRQETREATRLGKLNNNIYTRHHLLKVLCCLPIYSGRQACGRTSRGHTGGRSHRTSHRPSFCDARLNFYREKDSAIPVEL